MSFLAAQLRRLGSLDDRTQGLIALALAVVLPFVVGRTFLNTSLYIGTYAVLALGLNVVVGFTGLLDLGFVLFLATGAVVTSFLLSLTRTPDGTVQWAVSASGGIEGTQIFGFDGSILLIILIAGSVCALVGVLRGLPTLRVRGDYYAIVTLGIAEIAFETFLWDENSWINFTQFTGGAFGIKLPRADRPVLLGDPLRWSSPTVYFLILAGVVVAVLATHHLNRSRVGRALAAIRLDETAARACGVNVNRHKLIAFAVSGFIGGIGGALFVVWKEGTYSVKSFDVWQSILILCGVVLGGMGSIRGALVGITVLLAIDQALRQNYGGVTVPAEALNLIYGFLLIVVMRFRPQGLLPPVRRGRPLTESEHEALRTEPARLFRLGDKDVS